MKDNPFELYTGKEHDQNNRKCTKQLKIAWKEFTVNISRIQHEFESTGASDTVSREEYSEWVSKQALNGGLM